MPQKPSKTYQEAAAEVVASYEAFWMTVQDEARREAKELMKALRLLVAPRGNR